MAKKKAGVTKSISACRIVIKHHNVGRASVQRGHSVYEESDGAATGAGAESGAGAGDDDAASPLGRGTPRVSPAAAKPRAAKPTPRPRPRPPNAPRMAWFSALRVSRSVACLISGIASLSFYSMFSTEMIKIGLKY